MMYVFTFVVVHKPALVTCSIADGGPSNATAEEGFFLKEAPSTPTTITSANTSRNDHTVSSSSSSTRVLGGEQKRSVRVRRERSTSIQLVVNNKGREDEEHYQERGRWTETGSSRNGEKQMIHPRSSQETHILVRHAPGGAVNDPSEKKDEEEEDPFAQMKKHSLQRGNKSGGRATNSIKQVDNAQDRSTENNDLLKEDNTEDDKARGGQESTNNHNKNNKIIIMANNEDPPLFNKEFLVAAQEKVDRRRSLGYIHHHHNHSQQNNQKVEQEDRLGRTTATRRSNGDVVTSVSMMMKRRTPIKNIFRPTMLTPEQQQEEYHEDKGRTKFLKGNDIVSYDEQFEKDEERSNVDDLFVVSKVCFFFLLFIIFNFSSFSLSHHPLFSNIVEPKKGTK